MPCANSCGAKLMSDSVGLSMQWDVLRMSTLQGYWNHLPLILLLEGVSATKLEV